MRKAIWWILSVMLVLLCCGTVITWCYLDYQNNLEALSVQADYSGVVLDVAKDRNPVCFSVKNKGYNTLEIRETIVLSLFDEHGQPLDIGGTGAIPSAYDLYDWDAVNQLDTAQIVPTNYIFPRLGKSVQAHQAVYVRSEYVWENIPWYETLISGEEPTMHIYSGDYELIRKSGHAALEQKHVLRVDIILEGKDQQQWVLLDSYTAWMGDGAEQMPANLQEAPAQIPVLSDSNSYRWEIKGRGAYITGIGNVTEADIVIPSEVYLSSVEGRYVEDSVNGRKYRVGLNRDAFSGCQSIQTVMFCEHVMTTEDGVLAEEGIILADGPLVLEGPGFFEGCTNLVAVHNMPNAVTNMKFAFKNCTSLTQMLELPTSAENMEECFYGCESLTAVGVIPAGVTDMENCFYGCTALTEAPELPLDVRHLAGCFSGCTALTKAPTLPDNVKSIAGCFSGCTVLSGTVNISQEVTSRFFLGDEQVSAFQGCDNLERITVEYCDRLPSGKFSETVPVEFLLGTHNREGLCDACRHVTTTLKIDGLKVVMDDVPEERYRFLIDYIDHTIPDSLKDTCTKLTFGKEVEVYGWDPEYDIAGYAQSPQRDAYVEYGVDAKEGNEILGTLYHELAHCYDYYGTFRRFSASQKWNELFRAEEEQAKTRYGDVYETFSQGDKKMETFAIAVASYFTEPDWLRVNCPGMYDYVEDLFGAYGK